MEFGKISIRQNFYLMKFPFGETSFRQDGFSEIGFDFGETYHNGVIITQIMIFWIFYLNFVFGIHRCLGASVYMEYLLEVFIEWVSADHWLSIIGVYQKKKYVLQCASPKQRSRYTTEKLIGKYCILNVHRKLLHYSRKRLKM